ncbi:MAG: SAM-dependent methyltransferase [Gammaproteobacteria bacterium]|nr:SAM-dependent methyltransferase [Gammaproteobacteria bacterium]
MTNSDPWHIPADWPTPDTAARTLSEQLVNTIRQEIGEHAIPFARFMELALYAPGLGYYSAGSRKFGAAGDFVTAPEQSALFSRCLAHSCQSVLNELGGGDILELGAGSGIMACDLLQELEREQSLPENYYILEVSADLRQRQQQTLQQKIPHLFTRIHWLDQLPQQAFKGIILGNEVIDAMPVQRFHWQDQQILLDHVCWQGQGFQFCPQPIDDPQLEQAISSIITEMDLDNHYYSEINPTLSPWIKGLVDVLQQGLMLFIDYGHPRSEYYHPQRSQGTLQCYYRHRAHDNPLILPGLQDITTHVDFTAIAEAADTYGLAVSGYTTQAHFLMDTGIETLMMETDPEDQRNFLQQAQQIRKLMMPGEMGERFRCIALTRDLQQPIPGFRIQDMRNRL